MRTAKAERSEKTTSLPSEDSFNHRSALAERKSIVLNAVAVMNMEALNRLPWAAKNSVFARLSQIADISSLSKEERLKYDEGIRKYRDTLCVMDGAYLKGVAEGREKGIAEGEQAKALTIAKNMKASGISISDIQKFTGLSEEIIKGL